MKRILVDTGPLVAILDRKDVHHPWAGEQLTHFQPPLPSCESVLSKACFLVRRLPEGPRAIIELVRRNLIVVTFHLTQADAEPIEKLLAKYEDDPPCPWPTRVWFAWRNCMRTAPC